METWIVSPISKSLNSWSNVSLIQVNSRPLWLWIMNKRPQGWLQKLQLEKIVLHYICVCVSELGPLWPSFIPNLETNPFKSIQHLSENMVGPLLVKLGEAWFMFLLYSPSFSRLIPAECGGVDRGELHKEIPRNGRNERVIIVRTDSILTHRNIMKHLWSSLYIPYLIPLHTTASGRTHIESIVPLIDLVLECVAVFCIWQ